MLPRFGSALAVVAMGACVLGTTSCSAPSKGSLVIAVSTDMQTPKDFNVVSVFISTRSVPKYDYLGRVAPDGSVTLPATIAVVEPDDPKAEVRIRVVAFERTDAKVLRDVVTTVPHQRTALLRLPLNFLDVGSVKSGGIPPNFFPDGKSVLDGQTEWLPTNPTDIVPTCDFTRGLTMVNGACAPLAVDSSSLPDYSDPLVFGDGGLQSGTNVPASCFDVARCFAGSAQVAGLDTTSCTFPLPAGAQASTLNVALVTPSTGTCLSASSCYVPLPNDPDEGWVVSKSSAGTVQLAAGVCAKLGNGVSLAVASGSCAAQTLSEPVCEPLSADASTSFPDGGPTTDAAAADASSQDAGQDGAAADGPAADATAVDSGSPEAATDATVDAPVDATSVCGAGESFCGGACVDTTGSSVNCGGCGVSCPGTCSASHCQVALFTKNDSPKSVAVDSTYVYWSDVGNNAILKAPKAGGAVSTMVSVLQANGAPITVDSQNLYYTVYGSGVMAAPLDGGAQFRVVSNTATPLAFVADGTNLYWANAVGCPSDGGACESQVLAQPLDGGAATTLVDGNFTPYAMAITGNGVYWADQGTSANNYNDGTVGGAPLDGGLPMTIATGLLDPSGIAADDTNVYWTGGRFYGGSTGTVMQASLDGGFPMTLASSLLEPSGIVVDPTTVYFSVVSGGLTGSILSVPIDGGATTTISSDAGTYPESLAVSGTNVYWAAGANIEEADTSGMVQTDFVAGIDKPSSLAVSAGTVYATYQPGTLVSVPTSGGAPATIASGLVSPQGIAVNASGSELCWSQWSNAIVSMPVDGGAPMTIASEVAAPRVAISASDNAYWWNSFLGDVQFVPLDGGPVQPVATGYGSTSNGTGIAVDTSNVYFTFEGPVGGATVGEVLSVPFVGGTVTTLASGRSGMAGVTVAGSTVYWADSAGILSVPVDGGAVSTVASDTSVASTVVVDGTSIYWNDALSIQKASLDGGAPVTLVPQTNTSNINGLAVDSTAVYWVNPYLGTVNKVTPK